MVQGAGASHWSWQRDAGMAVPGQAAVETQQVDRINSSIQAAAAV